MSYIVVFPGPEGDEQVVLCTTLDEATGVAEDLRNRRAIADVRLGRVEPIAFTFAPQYRVSLEEARYEPATAVPVETVAHVTGASAAGSDEPERVQPGELSADEIAEMVAVDEAAAELSADDPVVQEALARRDDAQRQHGLFGR